VRPDNGPDGLPSGAIKLSGRPNSYVSFPNNGKLDTVDEITITVWVKPKRAGPIFHYKPKTWGGVHVWVVGRPGQRKFFVRFSTRSGKTVRAIRSSHVKMGRWNYLAVTYDKKKGVGTIWRNGIPVAQVLMEHSNLRYIFPSLTRFKLFQTAILISGEEEENVARSKEPESQAVSNRFEFKKETHCFSHS